MAIVGGGITGAAVAYLFASAGISVAVVDAARGRTREHSGEHRAVGAETDADFRELAARYGPARAARMWDLSRDATRSFVRTLQRLKIWFDLEPRDSVYSQARANHAVVLADEFAQRQRQGLGGRWLDAAALKRATGIDGQAGIRARKQVRVDPFKACIGLLRAAERLWRARVREVRRASDRHRPTPGRGPDPRRHPPREHGRHRDRLRRAGIQAAGRTLSPRTPIRGRNRPAPRGDAPPARAGRPDVVGDLERPFR